MPLCKECRHKEIKSDNCRDYYYCKVRSFIRAIYNNKYKFLEWEQPYSIACKDFEEEKYDM